MIYMTDDCQEKYEHCIKKCKQDNTPRISLVFKKVNNLFGIKEKLIMPSNK